MGKAKTLSNVAPTVETFNPNTGAVTTVTVDLSPEQKRQDAKREGSREAKLERQDARPVEVVGPVVTTSIAKVPFTFATIRTAKELIDGMQDLNVQPQGVYVSVEGGIRTLYFTMTKIVPKPGIEEKEYYNAGETKTVYLYAKWTEYGEFKFYGERHGMSKAQLNAALTYAELASKADMKLVDIKAESARRDGKVRAPSRNMLITKEIDANEITI